MTSQRSSLGHLVRRFLTSLSRTPPSDTDQLWVRSNLTAAEFALWSRFGPADRRHSITVARRFVALRPGADRAEVAGALLHDIGKIDADLSTLARVAATVVGPRTPKFRRHHDHERIGAEMLRAAGSDAVTVALVSGNGCGGAAGDAAAALRAADEI